MKIVFLLDDQTYLVSSPEELQLRQIEPGIAAIVLPAGKNENGEDLVRPLVKYPVILVTPPPMPVEEPTTPVEETNA
jgi:hypothetical protein